MASMNPAQNQVYLSMTSPPQAFKDLSIERELFKPTGKPGSLNRKRTRKKDFVIISPDEVQKVENTIDEEEVKHRLEDHFMVLRDIAENERLRRELNHTLSSIKLYEEYKRQKKKRYTSNTG